MKKPTFLTYEKPLLTCMVQAYTPDRIKELVTLSLTEGAEAFGMQFEKMRVEYRNKDTYKELFAFAYPKPVYVTNYRKQRGKADEDKSDDIYANELVELAECGATLCDVMGDYFDPCEDELSMNEEAIEKQMKLIGELHKRGAEVLMSSHVCKFIPAERVLEIALEHQRRGADICKIVINASNMAEQLENMRIINLLKENLRIPFLLLCGGECSILRRIGGNLGNCMSLCVYEHDEVATKSQPLLRQVKAIRDNI